MFQIDWLPRTTSRDEFYRLWRIVRKNEREAVRQDRSTIGIRARCHEHMVACTVDGMVSLNESSMDCDCVRSESSRIVPAVLVAIEKRIDDIYSWAEGPTSVWIDKPENGIEDSWRDLALEAYENGHPYSIHA